MKCKTVSMYDGVKTHYLGTLTLYRYRLCLLSPELILLDIVARWFLRKFSTFYHVCNIIFRLQLM